MKLKKMALYTAPIVLAGALYLGGASGVDEVLAKTIKTKVTSYITQTEYEFLDYHYNNKTDFEDNDCLYIYKEQKGSVPYSYVVYDVYTLSETEIEVPDDEISNKVVPTVDPEKAEQERREAEQERRAAEQERREAEQKRREEAALQEQKATEQKVEDFKTELVAQVKQLRSAAASADHPSAATTDTAETNVTVVMKTDYFTCFTTEMMELLAANPDVNYEIHYRYQGKRYVLIIPAGTDFSSLESSDGYYGFRYLDSIFGGYEVVE